jgi:hypothetical protein
MKKLMITTAIASSLLMSSAIAQTTITGELRINYKAIDAKKDPFGGQTQAVGTIGTYNNSISSGATPTMATIANVAADGTGNTYQGFGQEQQINIQTKGKLNVLGLDYAAGMSIENDGDQGATLFNENTYIDITNASTKTTLSISRDHIQRSDSDRSAAVLVGFSPNDLSQAQYATTTLFQQNIGAAPGQAMGAAIIQGTPIGNFSVNFVPNTTVAASEDVTNDTKSVYEYGFVGDLGVKGLEAYYFKNKDTDTVSTSLTKAQAKSWGVKYNMGQISLGYADKKHNTAAIALNETSEKHYGVSYAVNKDLTVGLLYAKAKIDGAASATKDDEQTGTQKVKAIQVGYALGPVDLAVSYAKNTDMLAVEGNDTTVGMVRLIGKF